MDIQSRIDELRQEIESLEDEMEEEVRGSPHYNYLKGKSMAKYEEIEHLAGERDNSIKAVMVLSHADNTFGVEFIEGGVGSVSYDQAVNHVKTLHMASTQDKVTLKAMIKAAFKSAEEEGDRNVYAYLFRHLHGDKLRDGGHSYTPSTPETRQEYEARLSQFEKIEAEK